ncbi:MAG TPA: Ig-like domain-containing protein [Catenuloplanes sp.]
MNLGTSRRTWKVVAAAAAATLASVALSAVTAPAANADGKVFTGNKKCGDLLPGTLELKVEPVNSGTYAGGALTVTLNVYELAADVPDHPGNQTGNQVFDFSASGGAVLGVAVKGGPDTNFYASPMGVSTAKALHAPLNTNNNKFPGLSHVSFCYVPKAKPTIVTKVSNANVTIGEQVTDTATVAGGNSPTGSVTFKVYGPDDATCSGAAVTVGSVPVNGNGSYPSAAFTPDAVGTYRWVASYSGDALNHGASGACGDANEQVVVNKAKPKLVTKVSNAEITIGDQATDTATLSVGHQATGTITFKVYGPDDATCSGAAVTVGSVPVNGNGSYPTAAFTPDAVGTYRWVASYSGDARNEAASGACNDPNEQVKVKKAKPSLTTTPNLLPNDTATVAGLVGPSGGTLSFTLFTNLTCTGTPSYAETQQVNADGSYVTHNTTVRVSADASISWLVEYSGDAKNEAAVSACTDEQVVMNFTPLN